MIWLGIYMFLDVSVYRGIGHAWEAYDGEPTNIQNIDSSTDLKKLLCLNR